MMNMKNGAQRARNPEFYMDHQKYKQTVNGIPKLRPMCNKSPTYQLAKYFVGILEPYTKK